MQAEKNLELIYVIGRELEPVYGVLGAPITNHSHIWLKPESIEHQILILGQGTPSSSGKTSSNSSKISDY